MIFTSAGQSQVRLTCSAPAEAIRLRNGRSLASLRTASASTFASLGGKRIPVRSCSKISAGPPTAAAAMASPCSIPSNTTIPNGSYQLGTTRISATQYQRATSDGVSHPVKCTWLRYGNKVSMSQVRSISAPPPYPPTKTNLTSGNSPKTVGIAWSNSRMPFRSTNRPL